VGLRLTLVSIELVTTRNGVLCVSGVLMYGPPGTGKTMMAKAVAHATTAAFISVVGSEFVQKYLGEVRWLQGRIESLSRMQRGLNPHQGV
jgi:ATP-dependent 26S proteasome regulatory subunit